MKTVLAPNAPWPGRKIVPHPKPKPEPKPKKPKVVAPVVKVEEQLKRRLTTKVMFVSFDQDGEIMEMHNVDLVPQPRIEGCHSYKGAAAVIFNEGIRTAERLYQIGDRKQVGK
jgi:hypothetical protein